MNNNSVHTLAEAESYLTQFLSSKWSYTLVRMEKLMTALGNPERKLCVIHIGGTAGKGSTCFIAASILETAGYKVGLHMSPHLISITERLMINRTPIPEKKFVSLLNKIIPIINQMKDKPTYYEITVAMMFKFFADERVDIAVVEVGLGGRLDGTNILSPAVSVITNVGLDHTDILGDTVEKIVMDKREIIKADKPVVSGATQKTVRNLIIEKAASASAPLYLLDRDFTVDNVPPVSLLGRHQITNAALAIAAIEHCGLPVSPGNIHEALAHLDFPGRMEQTTIGKTHVILDGAHNTMKMEALSKALTDHFPNQTFPVLFAVKGDKNIAEMVKLLAPHVSHWYPTTLERQTDWGRRVMFDARDLEKIISAADPQKPITEVADYKTFLKNIPETTLLITGSLYLVGAVEEWKENFQRHF
ncbi:hypothetical protein A2363_03990 [Candidatus Gottesmanbacteria bacterium RIFOXYB1_FULL_47_11]|uniref:tetrahydrofolate synthase n=1 Tax=Candidatus Gottesmanbacteria bacterium RIFOXYB1_FULL_47_11 TaxID=1798401 RepID=A0A1F6BCJ2_9BACT|nr:MAG: hypothetical protein A2363_03990 [Candidatus Gottesmanbacteria bacterium RIFOXYB1_FULL_47_11]